MNELRPLLPYLRPYRRDYALGMLLVVVSNFFTTLGPKFIEQGIDALRTGGNFHAVRVAVGLLLAVALAGGFARYGMRQLLNEGWMHNRVRLVVGSFMTKDLAIDWRWGERWFMRWLIDGDEANNNGNWQWIASVGVDPQPAFRRIYNPARHMERSP